MTRREWLLASGGLAARAAQPAYRPVITAAFYIWTQQFQKEHRTLAEGVEDAFAATRRAGYRRVELMRQFFQADLRARTPGLLKKHGLEMPICYHGGPLHEAAGADKTIAEALELAEIVKPLGTRGISFNANPLPKGQAKSDSELAFQAKSLNEMGEQLRRRGLALYLHQHAPEMADNAREWRYALHHTNPKLVSFCLDLHWVLRGGQDPMTLLREAGRRIGDIHLRNSSNGIWTEDFGDGDIDHRPVAAYLKEIGYRGFLAVELAYEKQTAVTRPLEEDLRRSRAYTEKVFL